MKVYLVDHGEVVSTAEYLGEAEDLREAKEKFYNQVYAGDTLTCCSDDSDPLYTDQWGFTEICGDDIIEEATLYANDGTIEGIPESANAYWWSDDPETWYDENGEEWNGNYELEPYMLSQLLEDRDTERDLYNAVVKLSRRNNYDFPITPCEYIELFVERMTPFDAFNAGLKLQEDGFDSAEYIYVAYDETSCYQSLSEYIDEVLGDEYFCCAFNEEYALNDGKIVRR